MTLDGVCYQGIILPMCTETLCLGTNEFAVDTSWDPNADIEPVFHSLREKLPLVLLIFLWREQLSSIIITHNP